MMNESNRIHVIYPEGNPEAANLAGEIKQNIERFRIPHRLVKRTGIRRIQDAKEEWLIVICTPETPEDEKVNREINRFIDAGKFGRILTLLAEGTPDTSFPESLIYEKKPDGTIVEHEPLAANVAGTVGRGQRKRLRTEQLRLFAPILGVGFDDLMDRKRKARNRKIIAAGAVLLAGALVFLGYAVNRIQIIAKKNTELSEQHGIASAARDEAARQKDAAYESYVQTVELEARTCMQQGQNEKALQLLLQVLPDMQDVPGIRETFGNTLENLCSGGYVPVASRADYLVSRGIALQEKTHKVYEDEIWLPPPPETETEDLRIQYKIRNESKEYGYQVATSSGKDLAFTIIHFPQNPERDYFLRDETGTHYYVQLCDAPVRHGGVGVTDNCVILEDGTMIDIHNGEAKRINLLTGHFIPFFDENGSGESLSEKGEKGYTHILDYEECDVLIALTEEGAEIWQRNPFRYLYTLESVQDMIDAGGTTTLIGSGKGLTVFNRNPFRELYTIQDAEWGDVPVEDHFVTTVECGKGVNWLTCDWEIYDLNTGEEIRSFEEEGALGSGSANAPMFTAEGYALIPGFKSVSVWDLKRQKQMARIRKIVGVPVAGLGGYEAYGTEDSGTGLRSGSAILFDGLVYVWREKRDIPPGMENRIELAKELLELKD
ncbi:MAG: hypothetical protein ABTB30_04135 [Clostridia bacterium]